LGMGVYIRGDKMTKKEKYEYLLELAKRCLEEHEKLADYMNNFQPIERACRCAQCEILREVVK
jgi:hypothetical protein